MRTGRVAPSRSFDIRPSRKGTAGLTFPIGHSDGHAIAKPRLTVHHDAVALLESAVDERLSIRNIASADIRYVGFAVLLDHIGIEAVATARQSFVGHDDATTPEIAAQLYTASAIVIGQANDRERDYLAQLAQRLNIPAGFIDQLNAQMAG